MNPLIHKCAFTSSIASEHRDKHCAKGKEAVGGSGITVWEHSCTCGTKLYSVSQWQYAPDKGGVVDAKMSRFKVATPPPEVPVAGMFDTPLKPKHKPKRHGKKELLLPNEK